MQLRKVCNHPNLFEARPTVSPFQMEGIDFHTASLAWSALDYDPFKVCKNNSDNIQLYELYEPKFECILNATHVTICWFIIVKQCSLMWGY